MLYSGKCSDCLLALNLMVHEISMDLLHLHETEGERVKCKVERHRRGILVRSYCILIC